MRRSLTLTVTSTCQAVRCQGNRLLSSQFATTPLPLRFITAMLLYFAHTAHLLQPLDGNTNLHLEDLLHTETETRLPSVYLLTSTSDQIPLETLILWSPGS